MEQRKVGIECVIFLEWIGKIIAMAMEWTLRQNPHHLEKEKIKTRVQVWTLKPVEQCIL